MPHHPTLSAQTRSTALNNDDYTRRACSKILITFVFSCCQYPFYWTLRAENSMPLEQSLQ